MSDEIIKAPTTRQYVWHPGKLISLKCPSWKRVIGRNPPNQFLLFTVIQVSSFAVVTSSYLDSTTWPSRRFSRSLRTSELSSTAATVYANLEGMKEGSSLYNFVIIATWEIRNSNHFIPEFRAGLIPRKAQQREAPHHRLISKSIRIEPAQADTQSPSQTTKNVNINPHVTQNETTLFPCVPICAIKIVWVHLDFPQYRITNTNEQK